MTLNQFPPRFDTAELKTGVRLRYVQQGDPAGPTMILLHGYSDSWFTWSEVLPRFSPSYHIIALDQRGHGDSDRPIGGYAVDDFAADVLAFMDAAGLTTVTLMGHSLGSWIAQGVASTAPHRIERLVLVGTSLSPIAAAKELNAAVQEFADPVPEDFIREFQASTCHRPIPDVFFERIVAESRKLPARVWQAIAAGWLQKDRWAEPERLRMPVQVFWGDRDAYFLREDQDRLLTALPSAALTVYTETGHNPHWEQPARFVRDVEEFLRATSPAAAE